MVGLYGGAPLEYAGINEQGTAAVPSTTGQVLGATFGEGLAENLTPRLFRSAGRFASETGIVGVDDWGNPLTVEPDPLIDPATANAEFGIKGALSFDKPVTRAIAQDLYEHKRDQLQREDTIARREGDLTTGGTARFVTSLGAGVLDPINLAAGFIPVVGQVREAALIAQAGSAAARAGTRAALGGAQGAAAMAALQPLDYGLSLQEHEDYTMATALRNIALGTVLGGGLHAGTGALIDRASGRYSNPVTQRLEDAGPEAREAMLQGALAQTVEGKPVDVAPVLNAVEADPPLTPKFTFDREVPVGPIARESNNYFVRDASGAEVARAHLTFDDGGTRAHLQYIDTATEGEPGNVLGPATMREIGRSFFQAYPEVREIAGERVSGARLARDMNNLGDAETVTVTRDQLLRDRRSAVDDVLTTARREPAVDPTVKADADRAVSQPSDTLQALQKEIADLERMQKPSEEPTPTGEVAPARETARTAVDIAAEEAEARASAIERAGLCITRGG